MKLDLTLDYDLGEGFLAAHLDGRREGRAIAGRCDACGRVALPPEPVCRCGQPVTAMVTLAGGAEILWRTTGAEGDVALVRFGGAGTLSLARLSGFAAEDRGRIVADPGAALVIVPETIS